MSAIDHIYAAHVDIELSKSGNGTMEYKINFGDSLLKIVATREVLN